jgi:hypothetical protein
MTTPKRRFATPETLTDDTQVLGVPVREWDRAFVGDFDKSLDEVKRRAERLKQAQCVPPAR